MKRMLRVFVTSEDPVLEERLCTLVRASGHQPLCRPQPSFADFQGGLPDLLLLDLHAGEERGLELLRRLVRHRLHRRTPVIVVSERPELEFDLIDAYDFLDRQLDPQRLQDGLALLARLPSAVEGDFLPLRGEAARPFQEFLAAHAGLHFDQRNMRMLERGLHRRMYAVQSPDYTAYLRYLEANFESRGELKKLLSLLTVGETYFFRYRSDREALIQHVLPELIRRRRNERRLFIWSAGCSTGEEPYSIAILLLEHFPQLAGWQIDILATDINKRSLQQARRGIYGNHALRLTAGPYRERYFTPVEGECYRLDPRVSRMVRFAYQNLQAPEFPACSAGKAPDIIFCRNVLIYFRRETFVQIIERFSRCLPADGYLFLGHSENLAGLGEFFQPVQLHGAFFYQPTAQGDSSRRGAQPTVPSPIKPLPVAASVRPTRSPPPAAAVPDARPVLLPPPAVAPPNLPGLLEKARAAFDREDFTGAERLYGEVLRHAPGEVEAIIGQGLILANQGNYAAARQRCDEAVRSNDLHPQAYYLRAQILDMEGRLEEAAAEYRKVLWLQMDFLAARYALARIDKRQGRSMDAVRGLHTVLRQLEKLPPEAIVPHSGGLTREVLMEVCREDLARISPAQENSSI